MAYSAKYRVEFKDILGLLWRIDIEVDGYVGSVTSMTATGQPLIIETLNNGDDWFSSAIHGSTAKIGIYSMTDFQWTFLNDYRNLTYRVSIYYGNLYTLYWRGFLYSEGYEEAYDMAPYPIILTANDGLGLLKDRPFKYTVTEEDDTYYEGHHTEAYVLNEILSKIKITGFAEFVNIYDSLMTSTVNDSVFAQCYVDLDVFRDMSCYDVLDHILTKYGAIIVQDRGVITIVRPSELFQSTVYGRIFTSATSFTSTSITPEQWIDRNDQPSNFIIPQGGTLSLVTPVKKVTINHDYGYKSSWLKNYSFDPDTYDEASYIFQDWDRSSAYSGYVRKASYIINTEDTGCALLANSIVPDTSKYMFQEFGVNAIKTDDAFKLSISYRMVNLNAATNGAVQIYFKLIDSASDATPTHWLRINPTNEAYLEWVTSLNYITWQEDNVEPGNNEWKTKEWDIPSLPTTGTYTLYAYSAEPDIYLLLKDIKFIATSDTITIKRKRKSRWESNGLKHWLTGSGYAKLNLGKRKIETTITEVDNEEITESEYIVTNANNGTEYSGNYILGDVTDSDIDNVIEQFQGALGVNSLITVASKFVAANLAAFATAGDNLSSIAEVLYFQAITAGVDFTGASSITNTSGDLSGTVETVTANSSTQHKIIDFTFSGTSGAGTVKITDIPTGITQGTITYATSISASIDSFIYNYSGTFSSAGYTLTHYSTNVLRATSGNDYTCIGAYTQTSSNLTATVTTVQEYAAATKRKDRITLSGHNGTASITVDGVTKTASFGLAIGPTSGTWATRSPGGENKELLQILGDLIKFQFNRPTHLLSLPMIEQNYSSSDPLLRLTYNLRDNINQDVVTGSARYFFINGSEFNVKERQWNLDLLEIVTDI